MKSVGPPTEELSFILIKPDGLARAPVRSAVGALISEHEFEICEELDVYFGADRISRVWPQFPADRCPFTVELMRLYLGTAASRVIVVRGTDAIRRCRELKDVIRRRYSEGLFANCVHCPSDASEITFQLPALLDPVISDLGDSSAPSNLEAWGGVWGRLATSTLEAVKIARLIWDSAQRAGWSYLWRPLLLDAPAVIELCNDDNHSLDYAASCLVEAFPDWRPEQALAAGIEADRAGVVMLGYGQIEHARQVVDGLRRMGLIAQCRLVERTPVSRELDGGCS
jgi:nucleoside diphosphate kinase